VVQAGIGIPRRGDRTEEHITGEGRGNLAVPMKADGLITAPYLAPTWTFQQRERKFYDRT